MKAKKIIEQTQSIHNILGEMQFAMKRSGTDVWKEMEATRGSKVSELDRAELKV